MTGKYKLLIYSGHCEIVGGDAKYLVDLVNGLVGSSHSVSVVTDSNASFERYLARHQPSAAPITYLNTRPVLFKKTALDRWYERQRAGKTLDLLNRKVCGRPVFRYLRAIYGALQFQKLRERMWNFAVFYRFLKKNGPDIDVFHFNNGGYPAKEAGLVAVIAARLAGVKSIVMSFHNMPAPRSPLRPSDYVYDYVVSRCCTHVIAASDVLKQALVLERNFKPDKISTIYCGLEDREALSLEGRLKYRQELKIDAMAPVLLVCGNLDEDRKGHIPLLKALALIKGSLPNVLLAVVGTGSPKRLQFLQEMVRSLDLAGNVRFLGYRTDVHELNCMADLAIVPSLAMEATPYTIKEAARAGTPAVTTSAGGCVEAVTPGQTGIVVPPGDVNRLAEAVLELLHKPDIRQAMGARARSLFLSRFLLEEKIKQHEEIYAQAVHANG